jgi:DNA-binding NarL/FixJ family response regulator
MIQTLTAAEPLVGGTAQGTTDLQVAGARIRIVIVEDQQFVADALHVLLSREPGVVVVGRVASLVDCLSSVVTLQPDIVICEFRPNDGSAASVKRIHDRSEAKVIFMTAHETEGSILAAIESGASAVLTLSTAADELIHAVRIVGAGGTMITPETMVAALNRRRRIDGLVDSLTSRERQLLNLMSEGFSNREIAASMGITYTTVRSHVHNVASKFGAHSKLELLVEAQRLELVGRKRDKPEQRTPTWRVIENQIRARRDAKRRLARTQTRVTTSVALVGIGN